MSEAVLEKKETELDMPSPDILSSLALIIAAAPFPVYGVVNHPLDLFLCSYGLCLSE